MFQESPVKNIDVSFKKYLESRKTSAEEHLVNGVPDYAFSLDYELRTKLMNIPHFYTISKRITESYVAQEIQRINQQAAAAGPNQFQEIYQMGLDCAHRLNIGVPNIFIQSSTEMNAYTIAADDASPIIVLYSGIVERMTSQELKAVIAHECGHIHNNHAVLKTVVKYLLNGFSGLAGVVLSMANIALMHLWTRAGEVTADRAALICSEHVDDIINVNAKLLYGGMIGKECNIDIDTLKHQLEETQKNPSKLYELTSDHPSSVRRIFASREFEDCSVFYNWRPDMRKPGVTLRSKEETDERCKRLINVYKK